MGEEGWGSGVVSPPGRTILTSDVPGVTADYEPFIVFLEKCHLPAGTRISNRAPFP